MTPLDTAFFDRDTLQVARALIGKFLVHHTPAGTLAGRIVETEAYLQDDPAFHGWHLVDHQTGLVQPTGRGYDLFRAPGTAYVYLIYGRYWLINVVTEREGIGAAVLIRALEPTHGIETMYRNRLVARRDCDLANGPGKLTQALGITSAEHRQDLTRPPLFFSDLEPGRSLPVDVSTRIGLTRGTELPYRFFIPGHPCVSPGVPSDIAAARRRIKKGFRS